MQALTIGGIQATPRYPSIRFNGRPSTYHTAKRTVVLNTDIDETFIHWQGNQGENPALDRLEANRVGLQRHDTVTYNTFSTSMDLHAMKQIAHLFEGIYIAGLTLKNGEETYINDTPAVDAKTWLGSLTETQQDALWQREVQTRMGGFTLPLYQAALQAVLTEGITVDGGTITFTPAPQRQSDSPALRDLVNYTIHDSRATTPSEPITLSYYPTMASFALWHGTVGQSFTDITTNDENLGQTIANAIIDKLKTTHDVGSKIKNQFNYKGPQRIYLIDGKPKVAVSDPEVNKRAALTHLLTQLQEARSQRSVPPIKAVITAGDAANDTMLEPDHYGTVPNYRILLGFDEKLNHLRAKPNVYLESAHGRIHNGLDAHLTTIG